MSKPKVISDFNYRNHLFTLTLHETNVSFTISSTESLLLTDVHHVWLYNKGTKIEINSGSTFVDIPLSMLKTLSCSDFCLNGQKFSHPDLMYVTTSGLPITLNFGTHVKMFELIQLLVLEEMDFDEAFKKVFHE